MALDKKLIAPGIQIRVKKLNAKTAGIGFGDNDQLPSLRMWDRIGVTVAASANIGDILTVIKKPRAVYGINVCRVANNEGVEGEVYWTELRGNGEMV